MQGVIEHITINNPSVGRSVDEAKRLLQAVQFVAEHGEVRPWPPHSKLAFVLKHISLTFMVKSPQSAATVSPCGVERWGLEPWTAGTHYELAPLRMWRADQPVFVLCWPKWCPAGRQPGMHGARKLLQ